MLPDLLYSGNASVLVLPFSSTDPHVPPPERRPQVELSTPSLAHTYPMIAQTTPTGIFQMEGQYPMEVVVRDEGRVMEPRLSGMVRTVYSFPHDNFLFSYTSSIRCLSINLWSLSR